MGFIGGELGYRLLRSVVEVSPGNEVITAYEGCSKLEKLFGRDIWREFAGQMVIDFGCGSGVEAIDILKHTDARVIGIDIREETLKYAQRRAEQGGLSDRCQS